MYRKDNKEEFYTLRAKREGYPARSVYKLKEINEKFKIIKLGDRVLDLGAAPGSWLLYFSEQVGPKGLVIGVDYNDLKIPDKENIVFIKQDIFEIEANDFLKNQKFQIIASDLAPKTTGIRFLDSGKSAELTETAFYKTKGLLEEGGVFICKIFEGSDTEEFVKKIKKYFDKTKRFVPMAVFKGSKEFYFVGMGYKKNRHE